METHNVYSPPKTQSMNPARSLNFSVIIGGERLISETIQSVSLPAMSLNPTIMANQIKDVNLPSNKIENDDLRLSFLLSDDLRELLFLQVWMINCKNTANLEYTKDIEVLVRDNENRVLVSYVYHNCWPTFIDDVDYIHASSSNEPISASVILKTIGFTVRIPKKGTLDEYSNIEVSEHFD